MEKIKIGKIVNAVALKGEIKVYPYSEQSRFYEIDRVSIDGKEYPVENVRMQGATVILKLGGIDDRNAAEAQKEKCVCISEDQLPELPEGEFYIRDLIGMDVVTEDGERLGTLNDVIKNTAQDLYEVRRENGKMLLIPGVSEFILDTDMQEKKIKVRLPEGLLDL